jgi:hypothetical protein
MRRSDDHRIAALRALNFAVPLSLAIENPITRQIGSVVVSFAGWLDQAAGCDKS